MSYVNCLNGGVLLNKIRLAFLFSLICLLIFIPASFAMDNDTSVISADSVSDDYYFDANIENDNGNGSIYNPYKTLYSNRIHDNSVIHLADGEYELDSVSYTNNVTIRGTNPEKTIVSFNGIGFNLRGSLTLSNLTLYNLGVSASLNNLTATNTIFTGFLSSSNNVISSQSNVVLTNCSLIGNSANIGGAISMNGGKLTLIDSLLKDNNAVSWGGAVSAENGAVIEIDNSRFINDCSKEDEGGAIYLENSELIAKNLQISNCSATIGGAILSVNSKLNINNLTAKNNKAKYYGGVIYSIYNSFSIIGSTLINNSASYGGAIFADGVEDFRINHNNFIDNNAIEGDAVFSLLSDFYYDSLYDEALKNKFINNDAYVARELNMTFNNNYGVIYKLNSSPVDVLPSYYNLRDLGQVSSVKTQGNGGNCWAFSALAALESSILKSTGIELDLSEENIKNIMSKYSSYGWSMETNVGGYDKMALGYFAGWLGPVNESMDVYNPKSLLSPLLPASIHIQNIGLLSRDNYTDNDAIKRAIMDYGAVSTSIYWSSANLKNKYNHYYSGQSTSNHAVAIVGWDDNYSKDNFKNTPPGDGAWIIKNSYGSSSGDNGFYYVSYYDTRCAQPGKFISYVFILNDTIKYDKIYQYDVQGRSDYFYNYSDTVWYKNKFKAESEEYLAAASTIFEKQSKWDLSVYVNNVLKVSKSGESSPGYKTIDLGRFIPVKKGDIFEIIFKVKVDANASVPIAEAVSFNQETYHENISFISYDGKKWTDFYDLEWTFPDHTYASQVACIKAFTILNPINTHIDLSLTNIGTAACDVVARVFDEYGNIVNYGNVVFTIAGASNTVAIKDGIAKYNGAIIKDGINRFAAKFSETGYVSSSNFTLISNPLINTTVELTLSDSTIQNPVVINANVKDQYGNPAQSGKVTFNIEGVNYTAGVNEGIASMTHIFKTSGIKDIFATYNDLYCYNPSTSNKSTTVSIHDAFVEITTDSQYNPVTIIANVVDESGNRINRGNVTFTVEEINYIAGVQNGLANITHVFKKVGNMKITAVYTDESYLYNSNASEIYARISLKNTYVDVNMKDYNVNNPVNISCTVKDIDGNPVKEGTVYFDLPDKHKEVEVINGAASIEYVFKNTGINDVSIRYVDGYYYSASSKSIALNVSKINAALSLSPQMVKDSLIITAGVSKAIDDHVEIYVNGKYYIIKLNKGQAILTLNDVAPGNYLIKANLNSYAYTSNNVEEEFKVNPRSTIITLNTDSFHFNKDIYCPVTLTDEFDNIIANAKVSLSINGRTFNAVTNKSGVALIKFNANAGDYNVNISFAGNDKYMRTSLAKKITVQSSINLPEITKYTFNSNYLAVLFDGEGKVVKNKNVKILVNDKEYQNSTNASGVLNFNIGLSVGSYTISVTNPVTAEVKTQNINVVARITENKPLTMYYGAGSSYKVKVHDDNGNVAKGVKVTFTINGKTYTRTTNSNGYASFKITLNPKTYTITANYKGYKVSNKVVVKPTLILKDRTVKKSRTFSYTVKLLNNKGKIIKSKYVTVKFKGKTYKAKTNSKGIATYKIKLNSKVGKFTLTASYGSAKISKKITVK